jgi:hypothetical protein
MADSAAAAAIMISKSCPFRGFRILQVSNDGFLPVHYLSPYPHGRSLDAIIRKL